MTEVGRLVVSVLAAFPAVQAAQDPERPPPYYAIVTAKSGFARGKDGYDELVKRVKRLGPYVKLSRVEEIAGDTAGWERWRFEVHGDRKLDVSVFPRVFGDIKVKRYDLDLKGTAAEDEKSKAIFLTSFGGGLKVKLMNRPKEVGSMEEAKDMVAKVVNFMNEGKKDFSVQGEVFSHGGTLAVLLEQVVAIDPPRQPPK